MLSNVRDQQPTSAGLAQERERADIHRSVLENINRVVAPLVVRPPPLHKAEVTGDLIAVFTSQPAMINYPGKDRENDNIWITNTKRAPKEGTIVKIIIKPHQP